MRDYVTSRSLVPLQKWSRTDVARAGILAAVYVATARLGLSLGAVNGVATAVWPPTGISLAALLLWGPRLWPGVACGALLVNLSANVPFLAALGIALGNTLEALLGVCLLRRCGFRNSLHRLQDVFALLGLAALLSTLVSASIGVTSAWLGGVVPSANCVDAWVTWWVGDAMADVVVAPLLLTWATPSRLGTRRWRSIEIVLLLLLLAGSTRLLFGEVRRPLAWTVFPFVVWAALRCGSGGLTATIFVASAMSIWATAAGRGPFVAATLHGDLALLQLFTGVVSVTGLTLAVVVRGREEAAEALRRSEARFHALIEKSHEAVVLLDPAGIIVYASPSTLQIHGYALEVGRSAFEVVHPDDQTRTIEILAALVQTPRQVMQAEFRVRHRDGSWRWVEAVGTNLLADPDVHAIVVNYRDTTERRRAAESLWASSEQLRIVTDTMSAPVTRCSRDLLYVWVNGAYAQWLDRPPEEIAGHPIVDIIGASGLEFIRPYVERVLAGERVEYEDRVRFRGLGERWIHATYTPTFDNLGSIDGWVAVVIDVTQRKQLEQDLITTLNELERRLHERTALFEGAPTGIMLVDAEGRILSANAQMERMFGYQRGELVGRSVETLVPVRLRDAHASFRAGYLIDPQMRAMGRGRDLTAVRKDGKEFPVEIGLSPVRSGTDLLVAAHVTDISARTEAVEALQHARVQLEQQVLERTAELRRANAALSELSRRLLTLQDEERRRIGKELHEGTAQGLTAVGLNLALLQRSAKRLSKPAQHALAQCNALVDQCSRELRTLSYLLHPPLLDDVGLASAVRWYADAFAQHSGRPVRVSISPDLGRLAQPVETGLFRILEGCLTNLDSHSRDSAVCVQLLRASGAITLRVEDMGDGVVPGNVGPRPGDAALGMWIVGMRERARELGGELEVTFRDGGTVAVATLPLSEA